MTENLAPIILFVYNRPWHTQQTLDALAKNDLAKESILYIYADGAKKNATETDLQKIEEVRKVISNFGDCKETHILRREKNWGLANNVIDGVTKIVNQHGKIIVLEDDLITSPFFLDFMNKGLDFYQENDQVLGVGGYFYFPNEDLNETFLLPLVSSWGWATWSVKWDKVEFDASKLLEQVIEKELEQKVNFGNNNYFNLLQAQVKKEVDSWAICFYVSCVVTNKSFLRPHLSLVQNIGLDNSGTHCDDNSPYTPHLSKHKIEVKQIPTGASLEATKWVEQKFMDIYSPKEEIQPTKYWQQILSYLKRKIS